jgi:glutathione S-transferase
MRALLFTTGSPFARGVRVILSELGLDYEKREEITTPTVEERATATPTLQVPTLWDGDIVLWESSLIAEYLLDAYPERRATNPRLADSLARPDNNWGDKLVMASVQTLGTAATTISQMTWSGVAYRDNDFLTRSADRLPHLIEWLEKQLGGRNNGFLGDVVSAQDIFLTCHLSFIANRPLGLDVPYPDFPCVEALVKRMESRQSFRDNPILWWEPGVIGYGPDGKTPLYQN